MKKFNTTGTCFPDKHYMVDISKRVDQIRKMVGQGDYFCINRGRQYGKTTTLAAIRKSLLDTYTVFSMSFESTSDSTFSSVEKLCSYFLWQLNDIVSFQEMGQISTGSAKVLKENVPDDFSPIEIPIFKSVINRMCSLNDYPIILLIDEVDQAGNFPSFIKFLGILRELFLNRENRKTFQSVILAGVYDIKNLKLKIRNEGEHQYNSPWNIAVPFDVDMSLQADGIAGMLAEYKADHALDFDEKAVAQEIYNYTSGYPFLVSRLCQIIDNKQYGWNRDGVVCAVHDLLGEHNTLFDDLVKKLDQFPDLKKLLQNILFTGEKRTFSTLEKYLQLAEMFSFIRNDHGTVRISNRILETCLYNLFTAESGMEQICTEGSIDKNQFIVNGMLNLRHLIERFTVHYNDIYGSQPDRFKEKEGRRLFLLYLRPIINGKGNYYVEAETRDETRTDIVIDYLGHQYVIETKIWRGNAYNERGEQQLSDYLDYFHLDTGYLVSFCFNKTKHPGLQEISLGPRTIVEAIV